MCFLHKWSKWEMYEKSGARLLGRTAPKSIQGQEIQYTELRQKRKCMKCNKVQDERIMES